MIFISIKQEYRRIMSAEARLSKHCWNFPSAAEMEGIAYQISEIAKSSIIIRSYNQPYNLTHDSVTFESDSAHTNLMSAILDRALSYYYGPNDISHCGYSYREVMEAVRRHDLPENLTGDIPDNGNRDDQLNAKIAYDFWRDFSLHSPSREVDVESKINRLLREMEEKSSTIGRVLYVADKVSAIIAVLSYTSLGRSVVRYSSDPNLSDRDRAEMDVCENHIRKKDYFGCFAGEMWTVDYFKSRHLVNYDEFGFFTALLVMFTLRTNGRWYNWRKKDYADYFSEPH